MTTKVVEVSSSAIFIWNVEKISTLNAHQGIYSDVFSAAGFRWRVLMYPKGFGKVYDHLSLFLIPADSNKLPDAEFSITISSQTDSKNSVQKECEHKFTVDSIPSLGCLIYRPKMKLRGMGWFRFMRLDEIYDSAKGYIVDDTCVITIDISCRMNE